MAGIIYTGMKIQGLPALLLALLEDFKAAGFTQILPTGDLPPNVVNGAAKVVLETTLTTNYLHETQPYRIVLETFETSGSDISMRMLVANPEQIDDQGNVSHFPYARTPYGQSFLPYEGEYAMGHIGRKTNPRYQDKGNSSSPAAPGPLAGDVFIIGGSIINTVIDEGTTRGYTLTVAEHGFALFIHQEGSNADDKAIFSFVSVQSPVDRETGLPITDMNTPIFCVYNCDNTGFKKFVVSEADVFRPTPSVSATEDTYNSNAILNTQQQVSLRRGNKYVVTLPNRLNTDRYAYSEELDLFAVCSADVVPQGADVNVTFFGEDNPRTYRAMRSSSRSETVRILLLVDGAPIPQETPEP